jgi:hypothetical protein
VKSQEFIDMLCKAGWSAPNDAQHENIKKLFIALFPKDALIENLADEIDRLEADLDGFKHGPL